MNRKSNIFLKIGLITLFVIGAIFALLFILNKSYLLPESSNTEILPIISNTEIEQGWYYGSINQEKLGTPKEWVFCGNGSKNDMWVNSKEKCD